MIRLDTLLLLAAVAGLLAIQHMPRSHVVTHSADDPIAALLAQPRPVVRAATVLQMELAP